MRTNINRITSLLLALVMTLSLAVTAFAIESDDIPENAVYVTNDDGDIVGYYDAETGEFIDVFVDEDLALVTKFSDVKSTAWYYNDVTECAKLGIVAGFEDGTFKPEDKVTGVQFVTMITRTFYNSDVETAKKSQPAGSPWYWANTKVAADKYLTNGMTINDNAMDRYDMANVAKNVIIRINNGACQPSQADQNAVPNQVKDWNSVPLNRTLAIKVCYATGVIAGMTDGKFHGEQSMTRAQACTVIMRMLKLINKYNPGDKDNDQYDDGKNQNTGDNNQNQTTGTLANGKPATVANVMAILDEIKQEYPEGTLWATRDTPNTNYYANGPHHKDKTRDVSALTSQFGVVGATNTSLGLQYACGGWMAMVSERIFGKTGAPARRVTELKDVRPGDIVLGMSGDFKSIGHVSIVAEVQTDANGNTTGFKCCDGNYKLNGANNPGVVSWPWSNTGWSKLGNYTWIYTRYPEIETEIESENP